MEIQYREEYVTIGGLKHYFLHYPAPRADSPVLLLLHGGPGSSEANFSYLMRQWWGDGMSLIQYDQRGAGKTLRKNPDYSAYPITKAAMLDDLHQVVGYLKEIYNKDKIVLMGHSWGTVLGTEYALAHPENIALYIAVGQVVDMFLNERLGFEKALELAKKAGNTKDVQALEAALPYPIDDMASAEGYRKLATVRKIQQKYNIAIRMPLSLIRMMMKSPTFVFSDLTTMMFKSAKPNLPLLNDLMQFNLNSREARFEMPICCIQGDRDYQTVTSVATRYFEGAQAPAKQIHVIEDAGHAPMVDQPQRFAQALHQVLTMAE